MKRLFLSSAMILFCSPVFAGGVSIGGTRLIYLSSEQEADISVQNTNPDAPVLIQSWVSDIGDNNKSPFIVTPPLFRLDAGNTNDLRVIQTTGQLAENKETLFILNIKVIPENAGGTNTNILQFAIKNQLKLIYRPVGLPGSSLQAAKNLHWSKNGNQLHAVNPSPYYVTVTSFNCGGQEVKTSVDHSVLAPGGSQDYTVPSAGTAHNISWNTLDDFGAPEHFSSSLAAR
ncbi:molecular chaperone [Leclercia adecarboxylata]|uniref:fimbrial biogenesis chaperone n=1 Tax=Leclercia adecarboxylata TaxID=83655 RepID=UPI002DBCFEAA|nr:molecular chaperone [Leclercia adecarboxylata]